MVTFVYPDDPNTAKPIWRAYIKLEMNGDVANANAVLDQIARGIDFRNIEHEVQIDVYDENYEYKAVRFYRPASEYPKVQS